jgi:hypothetical protein
MVNLSILSLEDYENWNNLRSLSLGGIAGVIKSILPYIKADKIYLMGITSQKSHLNKEIPLSDKIIIVPVAYVPTGSKIPTRFLTFFYSRNINKLIKKYNINSVYSHAEEILYWVKPGPKILYHMHGAENGISVAKRLIFRNKIIIYLWEKLRTDNIKKATKILLMSYVWLSQKNITAIIRLHYYPILLTGIFFIKTDPKKVNSSVILMNGY